MINYTKEELDLIAKIYELDDSISKLKIMIDELAKERANLSSEFTKSISSRYGEDERRGIRK